jgi:hypothetical protein
LAYIYYVDGEKFTTDDYDEVPKYDVSSPDENTPAYESLEIGTKVWCKKGWRLYRLIGPAVVYINGDYNFWLDGKYYGKDINAWLKNHPNPDIYFDAIGLSETERVLWFLQN